MLGPYRITVTELTVSHLAAAMRSRRSNDELMLCLDAIGALLYVSEVRPRLTRLVKMQLREEKPLYSLDREGCQYRRGCLSYLAAEGSDELSISKCFHI